MVRKPEQGTRPKLFYVGADHATLAPALQHVPPATMWGQRAEEPCRSPPSPDGFAPARPAGATPKSVEALGRTVYDVRHEPRPWGWRVGAYLWTKSIAAGAALLAVAGVLGEGSAAMLGLPLTALVFLLLTVAPAGHRPQAPRAVPLHPPPVESAVVARPGRLDPARVRRGARALDRRRPLPARRPRSWCWRCRSCSSRSGPRATARSSSPRRRGGTSGRVRSCSRTCWARRSPPARRRRLLVTPPSAPSRILLPARARAERAPRSGRVLHAALDPGRGRRRAPDRPGALRLDFWVGVILAGTVLPALLVIPTSGVDQRAGRRPGPRGPLPLGTVLGAGRTGPAAQLKDERCRSLPRSSRFTRRRRT